MKRTSSCRRYPGAEVPVRLWRVDDRSLEHHGIPLRTIPGTQDIWCRDYMPIQVAEDRFVQFRYAPDYLGGQYRHLRADGRSGQACLTRKFTRRANQFGDLPQLTDLPQSGSELGPGKERAILTITPNNFVSLPPELSAIVRSLIDHYEARIAALEAELAAARKTPRNSSLPPSSEHPHAKPPANRPASQKKRGGQSGHAKHERALIPAGAVRRRSSRSDPTPAGGAAEPLAGDDPDPLRHQVWDVPAIKPHRDRIPAASPDLPRCGETHLRRRCRRACPPAPPGRGWSPCRPCSMACFRQCKRRAALFLERSSASPAARLGRQDAGPGPPRRWSPPLASWPPLADPAAPGDRRVADAARPRARPGCGPLWRAGSPCSRSGRRGRPRSSPSS